MLITRTSNATGITHTLDIPVTESQLDAWASGMLIHNAMPDLTADQREFIMTGITSAEWDNIFNQPEDI